MPDLTLILLGAGSSTRFELQVKKQWIRIDQTPFWAHVTNYFFNLYKFSNIIVTGEEDYLSYMQNFTNAKCIAGGKTRQESLSNALKHVKTSHVMVSDVARGCIKESIIENLLDIYQKFDCVAPCIDSVDTLTFNELPIDRSLIKRVQTPQISKVNVLIEAIKNGDFTDESSAISSIKGNVKYVKGDINAQKLTHLEDLKHFTNLKKPSNQTLSGIGYDVHAFEDNKPMILGGIKVHENIGFKAHSDGDVALHALCDALLGAAGAGDIGDWFPDTDDRYKNANSGDLLKRVCLFLKDCGFVINGCDITIMAQIPKISPFKLQMKQKIASILDIPLYRVNIKATTTENLGFIGRKEGLAVLATANIGYFDWTNI